MSEAKHTPGPWEAEITMVGHMAPEVSYEIYQKSNYARAVASGSSERHQYGGIDRIECRANARLIAAAPDLLEALECAVACGMVPTSSQKDGGASAKASQVIVADMIRAAIAKATQP